jgi:hypothetical protein
LKSWIHGFARRPALTFARRAVNFILSRSRGRRIHHEAHRLPKVLPSRPVFLVSLVGGLFLASLLAYLFLPYACLGGATRFSPGYRALAFQTLYAGQAREEVIGLIGQPLRVDRLNPVNTWIYQADDWYGSPKRVGIRSPRLRHWFTPFTDVHFDADGRVATVLGDLLEPLPPVGLTRDQVFARYGMPIFTITRPALLIHDYSEPAGSPVWKVRRVFYTLDGRVFAVQGFTRFSATRLLPSINPFLLDPPMK